MTLSEPSQSEVAAGRTSRTVPGMTRYHIHVPRGGKVTRLPEEYDTVEEAILAFELDHDDAPWCLVDRRESDKAPFVLRGAVEGSCVAWSNVG